MKVPLTSAEIPAMPSTKHPTYEVVPMVALWLAACGGNVVVDTTAGSTGSGGASTQTGGGTSTQSGGGASTQTGGTTTVESNNCAGVPDPSALTTCAGETTGPPGNCDLTFCDAQQNKWEEICVNGVCQCKLNGAQVCTCTLSNLPAGCTGLMSCCFGTTH